MHTWSMSSGCCNLHIQAVCQRLPVWQSVMCWLEVQAYANATDDLTCLLIKTYNTSMGACKQIAREAYFVS